MFNFLSEKWSKLTILSKVILLVTYVVFSFPMFSSVENFSSSYILSAWYLLSSLLNIAFIILLLVWLKEKIDFKWYLILIHILSILLTIVLYIEESSVGFLRMLFALNITFLLIELLGVLPVLIAVSISDFIDEHNLKSWFVKNKQ